MRTHFDSKGKITNNFKFQKLSIAIFSVGDYFDEFVEDLALYLIKQGHNPCVLEKFSKNKYDVYIIINPLFQFNKGFKKFKKSLYVCIQTEQINSPTQKGFKMLNSRISNIGLKRIVRRFDSVFDFSTENVNYLKTFNENVRHINYGYDRKYDFSGDEKEYDIVFIGSNSGIDNRRADLLSGLKMKYKFFPKHEGIWKDEKYKAISKSKIALNIHFDHSVVFEPFRFFEYLSQRTFLISEFTMDSYPFVDGVDYVAVNYSNIEDTIKYYLDNATEMETISENGYLKVRSYTREKSLSFLIHCIQVDFSHKQNSKKMQAFAFIFYRILRKSVAAFKKFIQK